MCCSLSKINSCKEQTVQDCVVIGLTLVRWQTKDVISESTWDDFGKESYTTDVETEGTEGEEVSHKTLITFPSYHATSARLLCLQGICEN